MLTSLDIKTPEYNSRLKLWLSKLMFDSMKVELRCAGEIKLKHIEYINRSGKVNFKKIDKEVKAQRNRLLCNKNTTLPKNSGYKRFCSKEFEYRLCTNLAISILCRLKSSNLNVGVLDVDASFTSLLKYLLKYTDSVVVVSGETDIYKEVGEQLLNELGAPIRISKSLRSLENCDLIIAPKGLPSNAVIKTDSVVLTTKKPQKHFDSTVVYDYRIELEEPLSKLCPECLSQVYFASALYTMCHLYKLGSSVPTLCITENKVHTPSSLKVLVQNIADKTLT
ncbi:MAG: hypothetical protein IJ433_02550 [Ruminococcus sp.]|nr:hypothetical protein [Ruminococcus sp.]